MEPWRPLAAAHRTGCNDCQQHDGGHDGRDRGGRERTTPARNALEVDMRDVDVLHRVALVVQQSLTSLVDLSSPTVPPRTRAAKTRRLLRFDDDHPAAPLSIPNASAVALRCMVASASSCA
jgi:hypothetical protein